MMKVGLIDVEEIFDGSCRINLRDDYIEPEEPYEIVRYMIAKGENNHETESAC